MENAMREPVNIETAEDMAERYIASSTEKFSVEEKISLYAKFKDTECENLRAALSAMQSRAQQPAQEPVCENLKNAVAMVLEGWTLPDGVRKILETAYFQEPVKQESWISVEERLPETDHAVLALDDWKNNRVMRRTFIPNTNNRAWKDSSSCRIFPDNEITHWMPLPESP